MAPINIIVEDDGIYHKLERVEAKHQVIWKCDYPFTVDFGALSPLDEGSTVSGILQAGGGYESPPIEVDAVESKKGAPVKFKYTIAVFKPVLDANDHVILADSKVLIEDPEIIIDP